MNRYKLASVMSETSIFESSTTQNKVSDSGIKKRIGLIATGLVGGSLVALYAVAGPFVAPALRKVCLPFVPATSAQVENVLRVLQSRSGSLVDIGSGDGRIVSTQYHPFNSIITLLNGSFFILFNCRIKQINCTDAVIFHDEIVLHISQYIN